MLTSVQNPIIATATPQALGRTPTLSSPTNDAYFPNRSGRDLTIEIAKPADTPKPISITGEIAIPNNPDLAIEPTP